MFFIYMLKFLYCFYVYSTFLLSLLFQLFIITHSNDNVLILVTKTSNVMICFSHMKGHANLWISKKVTKTNAPSIFCFKPNLFFCYIKMFLLSSQSKPIMRLQNALNTQEFQYVAKVDLLFPKPSKVYDSADIIQQKPIIQICNSHLALLSYFDNDLWFHKLVMFNGLTEKIAESRKSLLGINLRKKIIYNSYIKCKLL